jgi:hypothetical protein
MLTGHRQFHPSTGTDSDPLVSSGSASNSDLLTTEGWEGFFQLPIIDSVRLSGVYQSHVRRAIRIWSNVEMDKLICLSIWKEHILIDIRKYDEQIVLPTPSPSAGPA